MPTSAPPPASFRKVIRDGYSMPPEDYSLLLELREKLLKEGYPMTKSGLLRAGVHVLQGLPLEELIKAVETLQPIKTGRPKASDQDTDQ